jgi:hypothetical protein
MGVPTDPLDRVEGFTRRAPGPDERGPMAGAVDASVAYATNAMEGLRDLLKRLEALSSLAREHDDNQAKIGELFLRVQDYVAKATAQAEDHARGLVAEAEREAQAIVSAARHEAERITEEARLNGGAPPEALAQLHGTVERFAHLNTELVHELSALNDALASHADNPTSAPASAAAPPPPPVGSPLPAPPLQTMAERAVPAPLPPSAAANAPPPPPPPAATASSSSPMPPPPLPRAALGTMPPVSRPSTMAPAPPLSASTRPNSKHLGPTHRAG